MGCLLACAASFIRTVVVGFKDVEPQGAGARAPAVTDTLKGAGETIVMPLKGPLIALEDVDDKVFSSGVVGQGVAIVPEDGALYSPMDGYVANTFEGGHAIGLRSDAGAEILIHIGIDTVQLQGEHFTLHVEEGQRIAAGQLLIEFNIEAIQQAGYQLVTPVVITNAEAYQRVAPLPVKQQQPGEPIIMLT